MLSVASVSVVYEDGQTAVRQTVLLGVVLPQIPGPGTDHASFLFIFATSTSRDGALRTRT